MGSRKTLKRIASVSFLLYLCLTLPSWPFAGSRDLRADLQRPRRVGGVMAEGGLRVPRPGGRWRRGSLRGGRPRPAPPARLRLRLHAVEPLQVLQRLQAVHIVGAPPSVAKITHQSVSTLFATSVSAFLCAGPARGDKNSSFHAAPGGY